MMSLKFVKGFSRIRKVRAFFIQGRDLKRATDFERSKSGCVKQCSERFNFSIFLIFVNT